MGGENGGIVGERREKKGIIRIKNIKFKKRKCRSKQQKYNIN
jgi:hypothetical protein